MRQNRGTFCSDAITYYLCTTFTNRHTWLCFFAAILFTPAFCTIRFVERPSETDSASVLCCWFVPRLDVPYKAVILMMRHFYLRLFIECVINKCSFIMFDVDFCSHDIGQISHGRISIFPLFTGRGSLGVINVNTENPWQLPNIIYTKRK